MRSAAQSMAYAGGLAAVLAFAVATSTRPAAVSPQSQALPAADHVFMRAAQPETARDTALAEAPKAPAPLPQLPEARRAVYAPTAAAPAAPPDQSTLVAEALPAITSRPELPLIPVEAARPQYRHLEPTAPVVDAFAMGTGASSVFFAAQGGAGVRGEYHGRVQRDIDPTAAYAQAQALNALLQGRGR